MQLALLVSALVAVCTQAMAAPISLLPKTEITDDAVGHWDVAGYFPVETRLVSDLRFPEPGIVLTSSLVETKPKIHLNLNAPDEPIVSDGLRAPEPPAILTAIGGFMLIGAGMWRRKVVRQVNRKRRGRARTDIQLLA